MRLFPIPIALIAALCLPMASRADGIDDLVARLGDESYEIRVEATRELIRRDVDRGRLENLLAASTDPEIRKRLEGVIGLSGNLWAKLNRDEIRKLQPTASEGGKSLYLARAEVDGSTIIGKYMPEWDGANFPIGEEEVMVMNFTLWTGKGTWKSWHPGLQDMIAMGETSEGKTVYAVRAKFANGTHQGTFIEGEDKARIPWGGGVHLLGEFEALTAGVD